MIPSPFQNKSMSGLALQMKIMGDLMRLHKQFNEGIAKLAEIAKETHAHAELASEHMARIETLPAGPKGDPGAPPVKGVHYFTEADKKELVTSLAGTLPIPKDGVTPKKGVHYFTPEDVTKIADIVRAGLVVPTVDYEGLAEQAAIKAEEKVRAKHIGPMRKEIDSYRSQLAGKVYGRDTLVRGGGDTVAAGSGIGITTDVNGKRVISATAVSVGYQSPTGTINGVNQTFTFAQAPNAICVDNGRAMQRVSGDGTVNWTGTTTIVLAVAPTFDIFGIS